MAERKKPTKVQAGAEWLRLRKNTVVAHWLYGIFCAIVAWQFFPAGIIFLLIFARWERWNDQNEKLRQADYKPEGDLDFWDAFIVKIICFVPIVILHVCSILSIRWY
jgi:hypothetical protein